MSNASEKRSADAPLHFLGVTVHTPTRGDPVALIADAVEKNRSWIIANHNLHSVYLYHHDAKLRSFYARAERIFIDGMSLVWLGRMLGLPLRREHRVTSLDWFPSFAATAVREGWRLFYLGSKPGVAGRGAEVLRRRFPGLQIEVAHGYFDPLPGSLENQEMLAKISAYRPQVLMVGMGMPRQEHWIVDNFGKIQSNAIVTCGAFIDYIAGTIPTPPRWMGRWGLEWLFRLLSQPGYLWRRYLVEPWFILGLFLAERLGRGGQGSKLSC